jgi:BirA family transcriptional regulator, biotin operon repressor / biotin---[acetyl-CoA-carboxylase] ligase
MLTTEALRAALHAVPLIVHVEQHAVIGSTNDRARELAQAGAPEIVLISADEQTRGRGRQGRSWCTPPGAALAISLLTRPAIAPQHALRLTMLAGLAAVEGIEQATGLRLGLKWPNDVVAMNNDQLTMINPGTARQGKCARPDPSSPIPHPSSLIPHPLKVGGILTEASFQGDTLEYAIVGLGLNVNVDFSSHAELSHRATSLMALSGTPIDRNAVLKEILTAFVNRYAGLNDGDRLRAAWAARLIDLGREIRVQHGDAIITGQADGVDTDGALLLRTPAGQLQRLLSGDVTRHDP